MEYTGYIVYNRRVRISLSFRLTHGVSDIILNSYGLILGNMRFS